MTPQYDIEDTSKALHSDGSWHILHRDTWSDTFKYYKYTHDSIIYHHCRNHWKQHKNSTVWVPSVQYRVDEAEMSIPCQNCGETCPEGLQGLWKLHNFNSIQSDPL